MSASREGPSDLPDPPHLPHTWLGNEEVWTQKKKRELTCDPPLEMAMKSAAVGVFGRCGVGKTTFAKISLVQGMPTEQEYNSSEALPEPLANLEATHYCR